MHRCGRNTNISLRLASFVCKEDPEEGIPGAQIDLVLWRADRTVNLFEMRYTNVLYAITRTTVDGLRRKADAFRRVTKSRDAIHWTFATPYGIPDFPFGDWARMIL